MTDLLAPDAEGIHQAAEILAAGGMVAFPTDTVYGVGISCERRDRLPNLFALKRRPPEKRVAVLVADLDQAVGLGADVSRAARRLAERWWPGPLTLVLPGANGETIGVRAPDHRVALDLIRAAGPLLTTSANMSGEPETLGADEVLIAFATRQDLLDAVMDGGPVPGGVASTVIDLTLVPPRVARDGPVSRDDLADLLGAPVDG